MKRTTIATALAAVAVTTALTGTLLTGPAQAASDAAGPPSVGVTQLPTPKPLPLPTPVLGPPICC